MSDTRAETQHPEVIHFIADGLTANGKLWYTGEELVIDAEAISMAEDRNRDCWFDMSEEDQLDRYGKVFFRTGPWPYARIDGQKAKKEQKVAQRSDAPPKPSFFQSGPTGSTATPLKELENQPAPYIEGTETPTPEEEPEEETIEDPDAKAAEPIEIPTDWDDLKALAKVLEIPLHGMNKKQLTQAVQEKLQD